jgi:predicted dinucleotide-binding enzyme
MKIGIIGAGNIGGTAAKLFAKAGHEIAIANSRGAETLKDTVAEIGENARAASIEEAAQFGEIVFISIPFGKYKTLPADVFEGKIVVDSNNYYPDRDGVFEELDDNKTTSSELLAEHLRGARIVKGFNTIWFEHLKTQGDASKSIEDRRAIFIAGDDAEAKKTAARLIEEIGFAAVDTGNLRDGGLSQEPGTSLYNQELTANDARALLDGSGGY